SGARSPSAWRNRSGMSLGRCVTPIHLPWQPLGVLHTPYKFFLNSERCLYRAESAGTDARAMGAAGRASLSFIVADLAGILAVDQDTVVDDEDEIVAAVAVDIADGKVARLDEGTRVAEALALEDAEGQGALEVVGRQERDDLDEVLADVGED